MPRKLPQNPRPNNHLRSIQEIVENARVGKIYLISGPQLLVSYGSQELIDRLAVQGPVFVVAGGNRYSLHYLPLMLHDQPMLLETALQRIQITRAETPYQLVDALQHTGPHQCPLVITDLLHNLNSDDISDGEARRLLEECLRNLKRLSAQEAILISAREPSERPQLLERLRQLADEEVRLLPADSDAVRQPALLEG